MPLSQKFLEDAYDANLIGESLAQYSQEKADLLAYEIEEATYFDGTEEEAYALVERIEDALADFKASLNLPEAGKFYQIRSASTLMTDDRNGGLNSYRALVYSPNNESTVANSILELTTLDGTDGFTGNDYSVLSDTISYKDDLRYLWKVEVSSLGTIKLRNMGTGMYLKAANGMVYQSALSTNITLEPAGVEKFLIMAGTADGSTATSYMNAASDLTVTTSESGATDENNHWIFEEVESADLGSTVRNVGFDVKPNQYSIITLPFKTKINMGHAYQIAGVTNDNKLVLTETTGGIQTAGTPFIYYTEDLTHNRFASFYAYDLTNGLGGGSSISFVTSPNNSGLLSGSLCDSVTITQTGQGYFSDGNVLEALVGQNIPHNSGTFHIDLSAGVISDTSGYTTLDMGSTAVRLCIGYAETIAATTDSVLSIRGVGYPTLTSTAYTELEEAIAAATVSNSAITSIADYIAACDNITEKFAAYKNATEGIQLPENGKAYTLKCMLQDGTSRLMYFDGTRYQMTTATATPSPTAEQLLQATVICRDLGDGKFTFVNNAGKYLIWRGSTGGGNSNKGYTDSYDATYGPLTISKMVAGGNVAGNQEDLMGYVTIAGSNGTTVRYLSARATAYGTTTTPSLTSSLSSAILIEEVSYPNVPKLNSTNGSIDGAECVATFSAPFATLIPEGAQAFYVAETTNEDGTTKAQMTRIEGSCIPANEGVILTADCGTDMTMIPVTDETVSALSGTNLLANSAGAARTLTEEDNAYVISRVDGVVAFYPVIPGTTLAMNKAYLPYNESAAAISMSFGGTATGLENALNTANDKPNAPVYDLSGRRISQPVKGGIYIRNGRKIIVK